MTNFPLIADECIDFSENRTFLWKRYRLSAKGLARSWQGSVWDKKAPLRDLP
jgi:hypothetical protein